MRTMYENFYSKWVYGPHPVHSTDWKDSLQTTTCFTGDSKESTLFYSTNPFNLSWETKNSGCGLLRIPGQKSVSLQRVLPEMGCPALSKFNTCKIATFWSCFWKFCGLWCLLFYLILMVVFRKLFKKNFLKHKRVPWQRSFLHVQPYMVDQRVTWGPS